MCFGLSGGGKFTGGTIYAYLDWFRVRKYASTEPTTAGGSETSAYRTAYSFQRKTFYDSTNGYYWRFSYDTSEIDVEYNTQPWTSAWTAVTSVSINTSDFSLWRDSTYVYLAYSSNYDILVRRGTLGVATITWGSDYTPFDGTGESNYFMYPNISQDSSGFLWAIGRFYNGTNYYLRARKSSSANDPSAWAATTYDVSSTSDTNANVYGVISPLANPDMYCVWISNAAIQGSKWTNATSSWSAATAIGTGKNGLDSNISMSSDTSNNLHLAYIDGSNYVEYKKYNGSWDANPTRIDTNGSMYYVTVSVNTSNNDVYAIYLKSTTGAFYYSKYSGSWTNEVAPSSPSWTTDTSNIHLTSNYSDSGKIFGEWSSGSSAPYTLNWNYLLIPENLWLFLAITPFIPGLIKWKKHRFKAKIKPDSLKSIRKTGNVVVDKKSQL